MATRSRQGRAFGASTYHILGLLFLFMNDSADADALPTLTEAIVEVSVNSPSGGDMFVVLRDPQGHIWLERGDFASLRLHVPVIAGREAGGRRYYPLLAMPDVNVEVDEASQHVTVLAPADAFLITRFSAATRREPGLTAADPGGFVNYQFSDQRIAGTNASGALLEIGAFAPPGVLTNTTVARSSLGTTRSIRLDTTLTHDFAARLETLNVGDAVSDTGSWGNAVRFAGVRWARNFSIRPDLVTTPLLTTGGSAVVPSTVDVFVNNQRVSSQSIPPGPFIVDNVPTVSGSGDVRVVVRDALGREQVMTQPFYSGVTLLAAGLSQYSVDVGRIRGDYAIASFHYGRLLGTTTYRRGLTDALTIEGHAEFLDREAHAFGANVATRAGHWGIFNFTFAGGGDTSSSGILSGVGFEHRERHVSFVLNTLYASAGFRQVGDTALSSLRYKQRTIAQASTELGRAGTVSLAAIFESFRTLRPQQTLSLTYNTRLGSNGSLTLTASRTTGDTPSNTLYLTYTLGVTDRRALTSTAIAGSGPGAPRNELYVTALQNPPVGPGNGWRLGGTTAGNYDADWRGQYEPFDVELEAARNQGVNGSSVFLRGAATFLDGDFRAVRSVASSFAVVDVAGIADIPVYLDNQLVAHTNRGGRALLPNLRAYEANRISIDPQELPLDTDIVARSVVLAPAFRSGVVARFPVERIHAGTFRLVTDDGRPVPAGALVTINGSTFPVALDGITYVTTLDRELLGIATWSGGRCGFDVPAPPANDPLPDLGTIACQANAAPNRLQSP
jgi:outer membrane usher protein